MRPAAGTGEIGRAPRQRPGGQDRREGAGIKHETEARGTATPSLSELLRQLQGSGPDEITIGELLDRLSPKGYPLIMLILAVPNLVPIPAPGLSAIVGLPLTVLMLQMSLGYETPRLPRALERRKISLSQLRRTLLRAIGYAQRLETFVRPRCLFMLRAPIDRLTGVTATLLSLIIMLPVPFGNAIPALAICLIAIGLLRGDGLTVLIGLVSAAVGVLFIVLFAGALMAAVGRLAEI